jgi:DNA-directed RNA polymerase specialized sigma24 family protein
MSVVTRNGKSCAVEERDRHAPVGRGEATESRRHTRELSAAVAKRIALLPQRDRAIVELTLRSNLSRSEIARAFGMSAGQVSRRLKVLYARLHDPLVIALFDERCPLAPEYRQLGIEHHLVGLSPRELADKHRLADGEVRRMLVFIRGWHKGAAGRMS